MNRLIRYLRAVIHNYFSSKVFLISAAIVFLCYYSRTDIPVLETGSQQSMPYEWIDKDTGHKLIRLTRGDGSNRSFYFHNNPFIPALDDEGDLMVFYGSQQAGETDRIYRRRISRQLYSVNLKTLEIKQLTRHPGWIFGEIVGKKRREAFYQSRDTVFAVNVDNTESRVVYIFPDSIDRAFVTTLNADENILAGAFSTVRKDSILRNNPRKSDFFNLIFEAKLPHTLFTINIETGELEYIHSDTAWINHVQFSPTDPEMLMFCHEGPWHLLDRIWLINITEKKLRLMHKRTVHREIAGHEFFSRDGNTIWFDLQIPRGETFYLASADVKTGDEKQYALKRDEWSVHFNISPDQKTFAGDGGDSSQVARAKYGKWIYLFHPIGDSLKSERLVNMKHHNYDLEPNVHFSPDGKWIIFRANFEGTSQIYAVEI
jgi:oligogalacturonide lyase